MNWYRFESHLTEKPAIDDFITTVHSTYSFLNEHQPVYLVYKKIEENRLLVELITDDLQIAKIFIDKFIKYEHFLEEPPEL